LKYPLIVVGTGSQQAKLKSIAKRNTKFVGQVTDEELAKYYARCKALIFPQKEDFGISAVEAQSFGKPVIAYHAGGALDTVIDGLPAQAGKTGIFFNEQIWQALYAAVKKFENMQFDSKIIIRNAQRFSKQNFKKEFGKLV
jgi:glycosyltransferase involved in cell wall biosynthesis